MNVRLVCDLATFSAAMAAAAATTPSQESDE